MTDLERALLELDVAWPATPDLAATVSARIAAPAARGAEGAGGGRGRAGAPGRGRVRLPALGAGRRARIGYAAALLAVLVAATLAVSPEARSTVLRWLGLESVEIRRGEPSATPGPRSNVGRTLGLGAPITLDQARARGARVPAALGEPDAIYETTLPEGTQVESLVYAPRDGLPESGVTGVGALVQVFEAAASPLIEKTIGGGAAVERLTLDGAPAFWITGAHGFAFESPLGFGYENQRLADRTLLVERGGLLFRVEGALSRERAVAIARSLMG